jgi:hypothetical protein
VLAFECATARAKGETSEAPASGYGTAAGGDKRATGTGRSAGYGRQSFATQGQIQISNTIKKRQMQDQVFKWLKVVSMHLCMPFA